jgi:hypothetical protein
MSDDLLYMAAVILMPIIPAFLLFRLIPGNQADVQGPFKGFNLKLGGAFAGYFVVMLVAYAFWNDVLQPSQVQNWSVRGIVSLQQNVTGTQPSVTTVQMRMKPPHANIDNDGGKFAFVLPIDRRHDSAWDVPNLILSCPGYETLSLELDPDGRHLASYGDSARQGVQLDTKRHEIDLGTVVLKRTPPPS